MHKLSINKKDLQKFETFLRDSEKSCHTIEKYIRDIINFFEFSINRKITKALLLEYKESLQNKYSMSSANSMISSLNSFLCFCGYDSMRLKQFKLQRSVYCPESKELTKDEYSALISAAKARNNARLSLIIQALCATGMRVSELEFITVEAAKKGEAVVTSKGKTRTVFLVSHLCKKLLTYCKENNVKSGCVFVTKNGRPLNRSNIWKDMKKLCETANVDPQKVFPHNLRHLFARTFYSLEKDLAKLADILGHSNINTTRIYIISTGAEHKRKIERMHLIM